MGEQGRWEGGEFGRREGMVYHNLVIFRVENISYVIISYSFNFVHSPYRIRNMCENVVVEKYSYV